MLSKLLPNASILKAPSNWFLAAFVMALVAFAAHSFMKED